LIEEAILADPLGPALRQEGPNGTVIDLSGYDEFGLLVAFRLLPGAVEFVALAVWD
jgi:hypothetical protein